ncbi:sperm-egg fusion protein TMEM95-like [Pristis pectinata]|uniref:sperm-egg fusion protein TMEM95-like n=1 Tax=Pristis pectinata TaxID=685728 RepID=UPI00223D77B0|nr:sperm-egg fusion protein TMEM95-like [Pristis pectinata]
MRKAASTAMITGFWLGLIIETEGCMFCALPHKRIRDRFEKLCGEYKTLTGSANCTKYTEANLVKFQFDELSVDMITEKVHRVLRVIGYSTTVINCSLCQELKVNCWKMKTCWPNMLDLGESIYLILGLSAGSILIGFVTLIFE